MRRVGGITMAGLLAFGLAAWIAACGAPDGGFNTDRFELVASKAKIPADATSTTTITAFVRDASGVPVMEGVTVVFEATGGTVDPAAVPVMGGIATTTLTSDLDPGIVIVTARTEPEGLLAETRIEFEPAVADFIEFSCAQNTLEADGTSSTLCTASVTLPDGRPVPNGTTVFFSTTAGTISPASAETVNGTASAVLTSTSNEATAQVTASSGSASRAVTVRFVDNPPTRVRVTAANREIQADGQDQTVIRIEVFLRNGQRAEDGTTVTCTTSAGTLSPPNPTTDEGVAITVLTSATFPTTAEVTCTAGTGTDRVNVRFVTSGSGEVAQVRLIANPTSIGTTESSTLTAIVLNSAGVGIQGQRVFFEVSGDADANLTVTSATTDADGEAQTVLTAGRESGTVTVTAEAGAESDSVDITINPGPPQNMTLNGPDQINKGQSGTFTAVVVDAFANPVRDGTRVNFDITCPGGNPDNGSTCAGVTLSPTSGTTTNGAATVSVAVAQSSTETTVTVTGRVVGGCNCTANDTATIPP